MDNISANFDLHATVQAVQKAMVAVTCHMLFSFALHGLFMAFIVAALGLLLAVSKHRFAPSLIKVAKRTGIFCLILAIPGAASLAIFGRLPDAGVFDFNSIGLICLWSLIYLHLCAAEIYSSGLNAISSPSNDYT